MKRLLLTLLCALALCNVSAQTELFGIPLSGKTAKEFNAELSKKGFTPVYLEPTYEGFYKGRILRVFATDDDNNNVSVNIYFYDTVGKKWADVTRRYDDLLKLMKSVFGAPIGEIQQIGAPYTGYKGEEMDALKYGKVDWAALWRTADGYSVIQSLAAHPMQEDCGVVLVSFYKSAE